MKENEIIGIYSTKFAFAAVIKTGKIITWGDSGYGGKIPPKIRYQLEQASAFNVYSTGKAFAALTESGKLYTWGGDIIGSEIQYEIKKQLTNTLVSQYIY